MDFFPLSQGRLGTGRSPKLTDMTANFVGTQVQIIIIVKKGVNSVFAISPAQISWGIAKDFDYSHRTELISNYTLFFTKESTRNSASTVGTRLYASYYSQHCTSFQQLCKFRLKFFPVFQLYITAYTYKDSPLHNLPACSQDFFKGRCLTEI